MKGALLLGVILTARFLGAQIPQIPGPFELPAKFRQFRYPQVMVADCSLPLPATKPRIVKRYKVGEMAAQVSDRLRVEGTDTGGVLWALEVDIKHGGCWLWRADLDRNGKEDLIMVTSNATSAGDSIATLIMIDGRGRPLPWQAVGHYDGEDSGLSNLVDLDRDGRAELLFLYVEGIDRGQAQATSLSRYDINDAHLRRVDGRFAGEIFPTVQPKNAKVREEPDLTNFVDTKSPGTTIASLIPGGKENCGVRLPLTRDQEGALKVDRNRAEALTQDCYDKLTLADGRKLNLPELAVLDRPSGREVAILDTTRLVVEVKMRRLAVQFAGRVCDSGCRPFFMLASDQPR
jgi:hypothetical protein